MISRKVNRRSLGPREDELVSVQVVGIRASNVRLGIAAPRQMLVYGWEIADDLASRAQSEPLVASHGSAGRRARTGKKHYPLAETPPSVKRALEDLAYEPFLVLSRKVGQKIVCGDAVLTVVSIDSSLVRLGIDVPTGWLAGREELMERKARSATSPGPPGQDSPEAEPTAVAEILARARSLTARTSLKNSRPVSEPPGQKACAGGIG